MWALLTEKPEEERLPVSEKVKVLRFQTLFKGGSWAAAGCSRLLEENT